MAIKAVVTKAEMESLDEAVAELYSESDGKFVLAVDASDGFELADVANMRSALEKERKSNKANAAKLKEFEGVDVKAARDAMSTLAELGDDASIDAKVRAGLEAKEKALVAKFDKDREALIKKHGADLSDSQKESSSLRSQLENELINSRATAAIHSAEGSIPLLLPVVRGMVRMNKDDEGKMIAQVMDGQGNTRLSTKAGSTNDMSFEELISELKESSDYAMGFKGSGATGSGAVGSDGSNSVNGRFVLSSEDARDPAKYRAMKAQAEKAGTEVTIKD